MLAYIKDILYLCSVNERQQHLSLTTKKSKVMATMRFEFWFALKEATDVFTALNEAFNPSIFGIEVYGNAAVELRAQVITKEEKTQFIQTAKTKVSKGVEFESYFHKAIRKYCITLTWRTVL